MIESGSAGFPGLCRGLGRGSSLTDRDSRRVYVVLALERTLAVDDHDRAPRPKGRAPNCSMQTRADSGPYLFLKIFLRLSSPSSSCAQEECKNYVRLPLVHKRERGS